MNASAVRRWKLAALAGGLAFIGYQLTWNFGDDYRAGKLAIAAGVFCIVAAGVYGALQAIETR